MRKKLILAFAVATVASLGVAAVVAAGQLTKTTVRGGNLIVTFGGSTEPTKLPKSSYTPVAATFFGTIATSDDTHPSAFREAAFGIDKDVKINVKGYPVCKASQLEATNTAAAKKVCGSAIVGEGKADAEIAFPEQKPIKVASPLLVFNGGEKGGKVTLLIHSFITVPVPAAIVTTFTVTRHGTGIDAVAKIPVIAGGSGSAIDFDFKVGKSYTYKGKKVGYGEAKCPDGVFKANISKAVFENEAHEPGAAAQTVLKGALAIPCTPKG